MHSSHRPKFSFQNREYNFNTILQTIPCLAGLLTGPGAGLLVGYPAPGALTGLWLGIIGSSLIRPCEEDMTAGGTGCGTKRWGPTVVGAFLVLVGIAMGYSP